MEDTEPSSSPAAVPAAAVQIDPALEPLVARQARLVTLAEMLALGPADIPVARDRYVGVPVLVAPSGCLYVARLHSHAAIARQVLSEAGHAFDVDHPDRTLSAEFGWIMIRVAGSDGVAIQIDRHPSARQRELLEDLVIYASFARRELTMHRGRPMAWSQDELAWLPNPRFATASDPGSIRALLKDVAARG